MSAAGRPTVTFLSDYGLQDEFVGVCHGVIAARCPQARVIDITHGVPPQDIRAGALALAAAVPFLPPAVHLAVVDPGVGAVASGRRRALALATARRDHLLVGPDNGLLWLAAQRLGGIVGAVDLEHSPERAPVLSRTFHGRDLFAPVAAALAAGRTLAQVGEEISIEGVRPLELSRASLREGELAAHVLHSDRFGNLTLDASREQLDALAGDGGLLAVSHGGVTHPARRAHVFADVDPGQLLLYEDARGMVALAVNLGSAAQLLGVARDDELRVSSR